MRNNGFTLVELLGVVILLGILSTVIIPKVGSSIKNSKEVAFSTQKEQIKKAASDFFVDNTGLLDESNTVTIKLGTLKQSGYLPIKIKNPKTKKVFSNESTITVTKSGSGYDIDLNLIDLQNTVEAINSNTPILILNGDYIQYVEVNTNYVELGATAMTSSGSSIDSSYISIQALYNDEEVTLSTNNLRTYSIVYSVTDSDGYSATAVRTVVVRDSISPVISFPSDTVLSVSDVSSFDALDDVVVTDNYDSNPSLTVDNSISNTPGNYVLTYTATDSAANQTVLRRIVRVIAD